MYLSTPNHDAFTKQLGYGLIGACVCRSISKSDAGTVLLFLTSTKALTRYRKHGTNTRLTDLLQSFEGVSLVLSTKEL